MADGLPDEAEAAVLAAIAMRQQKKLALDYEAVVQDASGWLLIKTLGSISTSDAVEIVKNAVKGMAEQGVLERLQLGQPLKLAR